MLTDDWSDHVDRRILQEATTLMRAGYAVVVLAPARAPGEAVVRCSGVTVEPVTVGLPPRTRWLQEHHQRAIERLNRVSTACQAAAREAVGKVSAWSIPVPANGVWRRLATRAIQRTLRLILVAIRFTAIATNRSFALAIRANGRLRWLPGQEREFVARAVAHNPIAIHAHDLPQLRAAVLAKRRTGVPLVYDAHELYPEIRTLTRGQKRRLRRREKRYIRKCDATITVNPYIAEEMARRYRIPRPVVLFNAIDRPPAIDDAGAADRLRERLGLASDQIVVLYQGWFSPGRGLENLVRGAAITERDVHIVLMGYGDLRSELEELSRGQGTTRRVHFLDAVPQEELLWWTRSADLGLIPYQPVDLNNYYCSPNKLFEFIQAGVPLIANDLPFLRDVVQGEGFGVTVRLETPADFAGAINAMARRDLAEFRGNLEAKRARYSWAAQEPVLAGVYAGLGLEVEPGGACWPVRETADQGNARCES